MAKLNVKLNNKKSEPNKQNSRRDWLSISKKNSFIGVYNLFKSLKVKIISSAISLANLIVKTKFYVNIDSLIRKIIDFLKEKNPNSNIYYSTIIYQHKNEDGSYVFFKDLTHHLFITPFMACLYDTVINLKEEAARIRDRKWCSQAMSESRDEIRKIFAIRKAKREKALINRFVRTIKYFFKFFFKMILRQIKPLEKPKKMKDRIQKIVRQYGFKTLSRDQQKAYYDLLMKNKWDRISKRAREIAEAAKNNDDDDDKFLNFLNSIVDRFGDAMSHIMRNKKLYLIFTGLIGTSIYIYKNRKALNKSLNEAMQEIEKKFADFDRLINNSK